VTRLLRGFALLPLLLALACGNPAEDKPEAEVGQASHGGMHQPEGVAYTFSEASKIEFVGSKVTGQHDGGFRSFEGTFHLVDDDPGKSHVAVTIDNATIWADNDRLTGHLKSPDFFDVATYPTTTFTSTSIAPEGDAWKVTGNLTLHGVTKSISFPAAIAVGNDQVVVNSEFFIKRFDFGIAYKGQANDLIRDEVVIRLNIIARKTDAS
jgi:polyisoprenoid-binding protein YceI